MSDDGTGTDGDLHQVLPVQRLRPGDHAYAAYDSEADQWVILSAFVRQGLIEGEKVLVFLDPGVTGDEMLDRLDSRTPGVTRAWQSGQLSLSSMRALIHPDQAFTAARQWQRLIEEADLAVRQGYPAMRAYIDMAWVADLGTDVEAVMQRERQATFLFDGSHAYTEVCAYDERSFSTDVLNAMLHAHPRSLLRGIGTLRADISRPGSGAGTDARGPRDIPGKQGRRRSGHGAGAEPAHRAGTALAASPSLRLAGEADVTTSGDFNRALRAAFAHVEGEEAGGEPNGTSGVTGPADPGHHRAATAAPPAPASLTVDLTPLHFLGVGCAADLLRMSAEAGGTKRRQDDADTRTAGKPGEAGEAGEIAATDGPGDGNGGQNGGGGEGPEGPSGSTGTGGDFENYEEPGNPEGPMYVTGSGGIGVIVNCTPFQARTLRRLGADSIRTLTLTVEEGDGC